MYPKLTYLLISITALLASSCNHDTFDDPLPSKGAELSFNVENGSHMSRGSVTTSFDHFLVYGDVRAQASGISIPNVLFNKTRVENKNDSWAYEGSQYWIPNYEHSFVAISPASVCEARNKPGYSNSKLSFEYSIPTTGGVLSSNGDVTDILIATHRRYYENAGFETSDSKVTFKFGHLFSLINIAPAFSDNSMPDNAYILIHKLEFSGIKTGTGFSIEPDQRQSNSQTDDMTVSLNPLQEGNIAIEFSTPVKILNNAPNINIFPNDDAIIMLPQSFAPDSGAELSLFYSINDENEMKKGSIRLNNLNWISGKSYTYKFTIDMVGMIFDNFEINPWNVIRGEEIDVD